MLAAVSPAAASAHETLSTLRFAALVAQVTPAKGGTRAARCPAVAPVSAQGDGTGEGAGPRMGGHEQPAALPWREATGEGAGPSDGAGASWCAMNRSTRWFAAESRPAAPRPGPLHSGAATRAAAPLWCGACTWRSVRLVTVGDKCRHAVRHVQT